MLPLFRAPIKPFGCAVPVSAHPARDLSATSGLEGKSDLAFGTIGTRMGKPVEPLSFRFCC